MQPFFRKIKSIFFHKFKSNSTEFSNFRCICCSPQKSPNGLTLYFVPNWNSFLLNSLLHMFSFICSLNDITLEQYLYHFISRKCWVWESLWYWQPFTLFHHASVAVASEPSPRWVQTNWNRICSKSQFTFTYKEQVCSKIFTSLF